MSRTSSQAVRRDTRRGSTAAAATLLAPVALMALMWFLSSQPDLSSGLGVVDLIGRKVIHAVSFGLLCLLWWRALRVATPNRGTAVLAIAVMLSVAYAAVDEYHQGFVPGRNGSPVDVAIDVAGACVAALLIRRRAGGLALSRNA